MMSEPAHPALEGKRIVITRPTHQQGALAEALVLEGAEPVDLPMIEIVEIPTGVSELRDFLANVDDIAWLMVTSPNGARVVSILHEEGCALPPVAALGPATADALGHSVEFVSTRATAGSLVEEFPVGSGLVVVVQGDLADETLAAGLSAKGWTVRRCDVYRTIDTSPEPARIRSAIAADAVVLASGSAARNWAKLTKGDFEGATVVIGPITAGVAEDVGLVVSAVADAPTVQGMIDALGSALNP